MPHFPLVACSVEALSRSTDFAFHSLGFAFDLLILSAADLRLNLLLVLIFAVQFGYGFVLILISAVQFDSGFVNSFLQNLELAFGFGYAFLFFVKWCFQVY